MLSKLFVFFYFSLGAICTVPESLYPELRYCLRNASVPYCSPGCEEFSDLSLVYNVRVNHTPSAIAIPRNRAEVQAAVVCASQTRTKVQARSGGHSYAGFSNGGIDGSLIIDLKNFQMVKLDNVTNIATVGPGLRLKSLSDALWQQGRRAVPHSPIGSIGVGGHFTHGGVGFTSRQWGLAQDYIVEAEAVLPNGTFVQASSSENPEIFYAIRGAASEFALVTSLSLRTQPAPETVVAYQIIISDSGPSAEYAASTLMTLQNLALDVSIVDRQLGLGVYYLNDTLALLGLYFGGVSKFKSKILPQLLRSAPGYQNVSIEEKPWVNASAALSSIQHDSFLATSVTVPEYAPLTYTSMVRHFEQFKQTRDANPFFTSTVILLWGGADSQISLPAKIDPQYSSFKAYGSLWEIQNMLVNWRDTISESQGEHVGSYINHIDPTLDCAAAYELYYGSERYKRLVKLKKEIDPDNIFWNPLSINP